MQLRTYSPDCYGRAVRAAHAKSLGEAVSQLRASSKHFVLLIASDTRGIPGAVLVDFAADLIRAGATYVCCWGPDCERFHDCFDEADDVVNGRASNSRVLMTTWHADECLEEALWFALNSTVPSSAYLETTNSVFVLSIGEDRWAERVSTYLEAGAPMLDEA
jgi:hypothetical protein